GGEPGAVVPVALPSALLEVMNRFSTSPPRIRKNICRNCSSLIAGVASACDEVPSPWARKLETSAGNWRRPGYNLPSPSTTVQGRSSHLVADATSLAPSLDELSERLRAGGSPLTTSEREVV